MIDLPLYKQKGKDREVSQGSMFVKGGRGRSYLGVSPFLVVVI